MSRYLGAEQQTSRRQRDAESEERVDVLEMLREKDGAMRDLSAKVEALQTELLRYCAASVLTALALALINHVG